MNQDRWQKVKVLFEAAVELAPLERRRFLDNSCGKDNELRREVENLLDSDEDAESFLEYPAAQEVASLIIQAETKNFATGKSFGHYEIIRQIGAGGMGEVYLAQDTRLDRRVAVKILNREFSRHEQNLQRFIQEAKAASALNHPNILVIHEIGETADSNYIVSEFIEGDTLREHFRNRPLKLSEILDISTQIANALSAAHAARIVHRDIKPENIMVRPDGYVKILDFGLAKLVEPKVIGFEDATARQNQTAKGVILGTVNYMSPEQAKGEKLDERTDIFSFGVLVYEMIAGKTPFAGNSMSETFANLINREPQPLARFAAAVPAEFERIVAKTLRKNKDERYQTMKDLLTDLKSLQKRLDFEADYNQLGVPPSGGERLNDPKMQKLELTVTTEKDLPEGGTLNKKSIAVLPFANMSADAENEYFCDGLAEELLNALAKIGNLKVAARTSSFSFKNRSVDISEIGSALNVETILEGSVRRSGNRLRITVQLVNAANGFR
ncbi:MAG: serine/threonine-protein kinase, partial [Pyrinomonadaceae bacterium]